MLGYLGNLMEDASDFLWDSAKACNGILLTNMEADRVSWVETDKVDRFHRAHAQRHVTGAQTSATCSVTKKSLYTKNIMICKYFQEGTCRFPTHHKTAGQFYRHVCENCNGTHTTKKLHTKNGNKKLGSHCSNAVVNKNARGIICSDRWVYNSDFHDVHLLNVKKCTETNFNV